jgi:hypothetical protein
MKFGSVTTGIIADGLVFNMDPANRASYPKTGIEIFNTINTSISGTFQDGGTSPLPQFDPVSGSGTILLDGVDDNINFGDISIANYADQEPFTLNIWFKLTSGTPLSTNSHNYSLIGKQAGLHSDGYALFVRGGAHQYNGLTFRSSGGGWQDIVASSDLSSTYLNYNFHNVALTYNSTRQTKLYSDGVEVGNGTLSSNKVNSNSVSFRLGIRRDSLFAPLPGSIGPTQIYNRALSANEVLHNYNALKGRFGL